MNEKTKEICVLGGLCFAISYIIDLVDGFANNLSMIFDILFVILFFMILFGKKFAFLQKFINKFPKLSVYLYYVGFVGYILFVFDLLVLGPTEFISLSDAVQKYIAWSVATINIVGVLLALILATRNVFFKKKWK
ncbi:MAG: hypothetical protein IJ218_04360 [Alphaproteobacteria bacterium]|nr:hypothetical protein [Alphaproteobacteria bacterium]